MRNKLIGTALLVAFASFGLTGCPGDNNNNTGGTCSTDSDCQSGDLCHPGAKICVKACQSSADCPDTAKNCATLTVDGTTSGSFCQCATDQLCGGGTGSSTICSSTDKICATKCSDDSGCTNGRKCDVPSGECIPAAAGAVCSFQDACTTPSETCNLQTGACATAAACSGEGQTTCSYGQFCNTSTCAAVQLKDPTESAVCANFVAPGGKTPVWNPATSTGPVIFSITDVTPDATFCNSGTATKDFQVQVKAYRTDGQPWPDQVTAVSGFFYVKVNGQTVDVPTLVRPASGYSKNASVATFKVNVCVDPAINSVSLGFYFTDGNEICHRAGG